MSENGTKKPEKEKTPIQILRERRGGVPKELIERSREQTKVLKLLTSALKEGPKTPPELAEAVGMETHDVFWYLMGMKKYGTVVEGDERDGYYEYALEAKEEKSK
jgi:hypothetical protein